MPELIERDALKNHLYRAQAEAFKRSEWYVAGAIQSFIDILDKQPTIEPEVRHGRWTPLEGWFNKGIVKCSACGNTLNMNVVNAGRGDANFCPNCGARMDGGADNG